MFSPNLEVHMRVVVSAMVVAGIVAGLVGCGSSPTGLTQEQQFAQRLNGTWSEDIGVVGSSLTMTLAAMDTTVTGTGRYAIEAGRSGSLTVSGYVQGTTAYLTITYDSGDVYLFDATIDAAGKLQGGWRPDLPGADPIMVSFTRIMVPAV
jgi:hypothetical protein